MTARPLLVAVVAVVWLLPATMVGAIALHVAFEHPVGHDHEGTPNLAELASLAEHGHYHSAGEIPHRHSAVVATADAAVRRVLDSATHATFASSATLAPEDDVDNQEPAAQTLSGPPRESGPPLLARLSTLRI